MSQPRVHFLFVCATYLKRQNLQAISGPYILGRQSFSFNYLSSSFSLCHVFYFQFHWTSYFNAVEGGSSFKAWRENATGSLSQGCIIVLRVYVSYALLNEYLNILQKLMAFQMHVAENSPADWLLQASLPMVLCYSFFDLSCFYITLDGIYAHPMGPACCEFGSHQWC